MAINPKFSVLAGFTENDEQPIIDRREARTTVRVQNGETFVLGGLRQRTTIRNRSGIPYLKDRKYIGKLFRFRQDTFRESELLVFITPQIIPPSALRTPREEVAVDFNREELDCIRRAPDVCWPCANDDVWKRGGPRNLSQNSTTSIHSAASDNPAINSKVTKQGDPTASRTSPPASLIYDEAVDTPTSPLVPNGNDSNKFIVRPIVTGQAAANSTIVRETRLPMTMRLKNAFKIPLQQATEQPSAGEFGVPPIGGPNGESGSPGLDLNQLLNILPMSGQSDSRERRSMSAKKRPIRLLRSLTPAPKLGKASLPQLQPPPTLSSQYSDRLFADEAITIGIQPTSQGTKVGKVKIDELQHAEIPNPDDDLTGVARE